ncbi:MAG: LPS export ABC transporter periplasmic protein LptC [Candidatus Margulisbacteria bacterium]|nr:LPS export ABC transporter periplasmic protein LptC [Candidatus Margulisiibacteriota bacterium]
MRIRKSYISILIVIVIIIFLSLQSPQIQQFISKQPRPDFVFETVTITELDSGTTTWTIDATHATVDKGTQLTELKNVTGNFYLGPEQTVQLNSPIAYLNMETSELKLHKALATFNLGDDVATLKALYLNWSAHQKILSGEGAITLKKGSIELTGNTLRAHIPSQKITMTGSPTAVFHIYR